MDLLAFTFGDKPCYNIFMLTLDTNIAKINKVGVATAKKLQRLNIKIVRDLLTYYPFRYADYSQKVPIANLNPGMTVNVQGTIDFIQNKRSFRQRMIVTEALINDGGGQLKVVWFNQPFIGKNLKIGDQVSLGGTIQGGFLGLEMVAPEYEKIGSSKLAHTTGLAPIYHVTANLTNKQLRFLIKSVIASAAQLTDTLPEAIKSKCQLLDLADAISNIHFPRSGEMLGQARRRLQFEELLLAQLQAQVARLKVKSQKSKAIKFFKEETARFVQRLPFKLTAAQKKAAWEIIKDIGKHQPMSRLLEGDVGCGKTVTAAIAMFNAALNKRQSVMLVPTEILANQHYDTLCKFFTNSEIKIGLYTRSRKKINQEPDTRDEERGKTNKNHNSLFIIHHSDIVVGTHALLQEGIKFRDLALAIIDEQHRFGVEQRQALRQKSGQPEFTPHLLSMTATPIPRSLAQVIYGDLDLSIIDELPAGRKPIATWLVPEFKRPSAYDFIKREILAGRQAFVICPLINPADNLGVKSVIEEHKKLNEHIFPELKIAYLHGRLKPKAKDEIMREFLANEIKILVATSVVEVGVDVPNASVMMIEGAERFGLAQLHQFRGRVGRSARQSYCLLFTASLNEQTRARLTAFTKSNDGFKLAEADLKMRGPGEVYGTEQKGFPEFKIATLNDYKLIKEAKEAAENVVKEGAEKYPRLLEKVRREGEYAVG